MPKSHLTHRENEILLLLTQGCTNQQIAHTLIISEITVRNHLASIFKKLKVSNRAQAALLANSQNPNLDNHTPCRAQDAEVPKPSP